MRAHHFTVVAAAAFLLTAMTAQAQSLADVARKEEERRKAKPEKAKVYTNKDLYAAPAPPIPAGDTKDTKDTKDAKDAKDPKDAKDSKDTKDAKDPKAAADANGKEPAKDKAYWSGRLKKLQDQLDQNQTLVDAMQTRINALSTDFVNRDDPAQRSVIERDRQRALSELTRLKQAVVDGKKAVADLEEEARRAGVPPGWLR